MTSSQGARTIRVLAVLWPAFLATIVIEGLLFSMFDPEALRWTDALGAPLSPLSIYSLAFLAIWVVVSGAIALAGALVLPPPPVSGTHPGA